MFLFPFGGIYVILPCNVSCTNKYFDDQPQKKQRNKPHQLHAYFPPQDTKTPHAPWLSKETNGIQIDPGTRCTGVQPKHQNCPSTQICYIIFGSNRQWNPIGFFLGPILKNHVWWFLSPMYPCQRPSMFHAKVALFLLLPILKSRFPVWKKKSTGFRSS